MNCFNILHSRLKRSGILRLSGIACAAFVVGCAQPPKLMYDWGNYQAQLYEYFKGDSTSPLQQLQMLEAQERATSVKGEALPPGFRAHLGLVNLKLGRDLAAKRYFEAEKLAFPESAPFMDSLLKRMEEKRS